MKITIPTILENFKCSAEKCSDNCCIGWEIDIDKSSLNFYKNVKGDFGKKLEKNIIINPEPHFALHNERCAFLDKNNLCEIYSNLGENHLCEICKKHPRFNNYYNNLTETGMGMCCEESARLWLSSPEKIVFNTKASNKSNEDYFYDENLFNALYTARNTAISILQNRKYTIENRLALFLCYSEQLQKAVDDENFHKIIEISEQFSDGKYVLSQYKKLSFNLKQADKISIINSLINKLQTLEILDEKWLLKLNDILNNIVNFHPPYLKFKNQFSNFDYQYENLAVYYVYRYFLNTVFDYDLLSKSLLVAISLVMVMLQDVSSFSKTSNFNIGVRINNAKAFSKEIEYSTENIDALANGFEKSVEHSVKLLKTLLTGID